MTALVRGVIDLLKSERLKVWGSMSTYTGTPPARITALEQEGKLKLGTMTSSPGLKTSRQESSREAVQLGVRKDRPPQCSASHCSGTSLPHVLPLVGVIGFSGP